MSSLGEPTFKKTMLGLSLVKRTAKGRVELYAFNGATATWKTPITASYDSWSNVQTVPSCCLSLDAAKVWTLLKFVFQSCKYSSVIILQQHSNFGSLPMFEQACCHMYMILRSHCWTRFEIWSCQRGKYFCRNFTIISCAKIQFKVHLQSTKRKQKHKQKEQVY